MLSTKCYSGFLFVFLLLDSMIYCHIDMTSYKVQLADHHSCLWVAVHNGSPLLRLTV